MRIGNRGLQTPPRVDLVPMMDVLMTVVTFFVVLSMTLNGEQIADIKIPGQVDLSQSKQSKPKTPPFVLGINSKGQLINNGKVTQSFELVKAIQLYYQKAPNGQILVVADKSLPYSKVTQALKGLRQMGGTQVNLAVQPFESK